MDSDTETYILLLLSDSNLPTGAFVASAGLESYVTHGFFATASASALSSSSHARALQATTSFLRDNLSSYARAALPFVADAHEAATRVVSVGDAVNGRAMDAGLDELTALDDLYERMTLNHVARRASQSQGVALLTLHARGFSRPTLPGLTLSGSDQDRTALEAIENDTRERCAAKLVDQLKFMVRREDTPGHLPICWGVLTAALGLSTARSQYLHLFLQARSLLSASVRLNTLGPYAAQQLLLHAVRPVVDAEVARCRHLRISAVCSPSTTLSPNLVDDIIDGPATTWPLGEILAARHDLQHSRIFNS